MGRDGLSRLYIGHLPVDTSENDFRSFLLSSGQLARNSFNITVKKGFAFMTCCDQATADLVIDRFNGAVYNGKAISIEPAVSNYSGAPAKAGKCLMTVTRVGTGEAGTIEDLENALAIWGGNVVAMEKLGNSTFMVVVPDMLTLNDLVTRCNGLVSSGFAVKAELAPNCVKPEVVGGKFHETTATTEIQNDLSPSSGGQPQPSGSRTRSGQRFFTYNTYSPRRSNSGSPRPYGDYSSFPWRMLVPANQVGAIIGRGGATVRGITNSTGARINIHTGHRIRSAPSNDDSEKVLSIHGTPEGCTSACQKILEILAQDLSKTFGAELALRLIAFDSLIGRVIGKGGSSITNIMSESNTRVHISNMHDSSQTSWRYRHYDCDRVITIRGSIGGMIKAEAMISQKLRQSYENDIAYLQSQQTQTQEETFPEIGYFHYPQQC